MKTYLYSDIPGAGKGWTLAVLAVSQPDADRYVKNYNGGGRRAGVVERGGTVNASCGAVTARAADEIRAENARAI